VDSSTGGAVDFVQLAQALLFEPFHLGPLQGGGGPVGAPLLPPQDGQVVNQQGLDGVGRLKRGDEVAAQP
jgi:hypothetical protein